MKMSFFQRMTALFLCLMGVFLQIFAEKTYHDSSTGVELVLPNDVEIKENKPEEYNKCNIISTEGNSISVYSVVNPKGESYSWEYLDKFDKEFGKPFKKIKLSNGMDGWLRCYNVEASKDKSYIKSVTLIRGKDYAFYMVENSYSNKNLISRYIIDHSKFPNSDPSNRGPRNSTNPTLPFGIFMTLIAALCFLLWHIRAKLSTTIKVLIILLIVCSTFPIMYWPLHYTLFNSIGNSIFNGILLYWVFYSKTSDDVLKHLEKTFS